MVLLKNDNQALPIDFGKKGFKLLVLGAVVDYRNLITMKSELDHGLQWSEAFKLHTTGGGSSYVNSTAQLEPINQLAQKLGVEPFHIDIHN